MRDGFDENCALGQPETARLPAALLACAALLALLALGAPAHPAPIPTHAAAEATTGAATDGPTGAGPDAHPGWPARGGCARVAPPAWRAGYSPTT